MIGDVVSPLPAQPDSGIQGPYEGDYDYSSAIFAADLRDPADIGKSAGERAVKRLGAKKMPTCRCPVVFDPRVARGFISHLLGPISGPS